MSTVGSVSSWIVGLKAGRESAAHQILEYYYRPLCRIADSALHKSRTVSDEEDVVIRAFAAFLRRTELGAYPGIHTRDDLWRLLVRITRTFAWKQNRFFNRLRRSAPGEVEILSSLACAQLPPDKLASMADTLSWLLDRLDDDELRDIAMGRLNGLTNEEIAVGVNRSVSTVERRMRLIRETWEERLAND